MEVPEAYKIGWVPFINAKIWLDSHPLIPRTETEYWVDKAIKELSRFSEGKFLDLCAGSGCIGVSLGQAFPEASIDFAERERRHHETIRKNIEENSLKNTKIFGGDLFEKVEGPYDVILSNPPYIDTDRLMRVDESVLKFEPEEALFAGKGGLDVITRILTEASKHLKKGGILYIEHEPEQEEKIKSIAKPLPYSRVESFEDQYGHIRYSRFVC